MYENEEEEKYESFCWGTGGAKLLKKIPGVVIYQMFNIM